MGLPDPNSIDESAPIQLYTDLIKELYDAVRERVVALGFPDAYSNYLNWYERRAWADFTGHDAIETGFNMQINTTANPTSLLSGTYHGSVGILQRVVDAILQAMEFSHDFNGTFLISTDDSGTPLGISHYDSFIYTNDDKIHWTRETFYPYVLGHADGWRRFRDAPPGEGGTELRGLPQLRDIVGPWQIVDLIKALKQLRWSVIYFNTPRDFIASVYNDGSTGLDLVERSGSGWDDGGDVAAMKADTESNYWSSSPFMTSGTSEFDAMSWIFKPDPDVDGYLRNAYMAISKIGWWSKSPAPIWLSDDNEPKPTIRWLCESMHIGAVSPGSTGPLDLGLGYPPPPTSSGEHRIFVMDVSPWSDFSPSSATNFTHVRSLATPVIYGDASLATPAWPPLDPMNISQLAFGGRYLNPILQWDVDGGFEYQ